MREPASLPVTGLHRALCALGFLLLLGVPAEGWGWQSPNQPCLDGPSLGLLGLMVQESEEAVLGNRTEDRRRQLEEYRHATFVPRGPITTGAGLGLLGLMEQPCAEQGVGASIQVGSLEAGARSKAVVAFNASLFLIPLRRAVPELNLSGHLTTLLHGLDTEGARVGPASVGASYMLWSDDFVGRPFARLHLPSSFKGTEGTRLGLEPGVSSRFSHVRSSAWFVGLSFPWLSAETLDGRQPGFHVSTRLGLSMQHRVLNATLVELGMLHDTRGLEQFTVAGAYRFAVARVGMEVALTVALGGRNKGTGSLALRFTFNPRRDAVLEPYFD